MSTPNGDSSPRSVLKKLPAKPSEENLKKQAKRRAKADGLRLAEAQHRLAKEYGARSWAELMHVVRNATTPKQVSSSEWHELAAAGDVGRLGELLPDVTEIDARDAADNTALFVVCKSDAPDERRIEFAKLLLEAGANPRLECEGKATPLHAAAWRGPWS